MESLCFLSLVSVHFVITRALNFNNILIVGPKHCERLTVGCPNFLYSPKYPACNEQPNDTARSDDTLTKEKNMDVRDANSTCSLFSKNFYIQGKLLQCKIYQRLWSSRRELSEWRTNDKLLVLSPTYHEKIHQVHLNNFTIDMLHSPFYASKSIIYIPATRKYLIVTSKRLYLVKALNGKFSKKIDKDVLCITVANDIIFYVKVVRGGGSRLFRMKPNGTSKCFLKSLYKIVETIQADTKRPFIYTFVYKCLQKRTYEGKHLKTFKILAVTICLSPDAEFVYFSSKSNAVYKLTISNGEKKMLGKFNGELINTMSALGDRLFSVTKDCQLLVFQPGGSGHNKIKIFNGRQCRGYLIKQKW